jgi:hypothetical protein
VLSLRQRTSRYKTAVSFQQKVFLTIGPGTQPAQACGNDYDEDGHGSHVAGQPDCTCFPWYNRTHCPCRTSLQEPLLAPLTWPRTPAPVPSATTASQALLLSVAQVPEFFMCWFSQFSYYFFSSWCSDLLPGKVLTRSYARFA